MQATAEQFETELMKSDERQIEQMRKQLEELRQNLRSVRHGINNNVAVIMAMAELSQRNPAQCQRLSQLCLEKAPQIAAAIGGFSEMFDGAMALGDEIQKQMAKPQG